MPVSGDRAGCERAWFAGSESRLQLWVATFGDLVHPPCWAYRAAPHHRGSGYRDQFHHFQGALCVTAPWKWAVVEICRIERAGQCLNIDQYMTRPFLMINLVTQLITFCSVPLRLRLLFYQDEFHSCMFASLFTCLSTSFQSELCMVSCLLSFKVEILVTIHLSWLFWRYHIFNDSFFVGLCLQTTPCGLRKYPEDGSWNHPQYFNSIYFLSMIIQFSR